MSSDMIKDALYLRELPSGKIRCDICGQDMDPRGLRSHLEGKPHQQRVTLMTNNGRKALLKPPVDIDAIVADCVIEGKPDSIEATQSFSQEAVGAFISNSTLEVLFEGEKLMLEGLRRIANEINERLQKLGLRREKPAGVNEPSHIE